jgi:hypothetical protein
MKAIRRNCGEGLDGMVVESPAVMASSSGMKY